MIPAQNVNRKTILHCLFFVFPFRVYSGGLKLSKLWFSYSLVGLVAYLSIYFAYKKASYIWIPNKPLRSFIYVLPLSTDLVFIVGNLIYLSLQYKKMEKAYEIIKNLKYRIGSNIKLSSTAFIIICLLQVVHHTMFHALIGFRLFPLPTYLHPVKFVMMFLIIDHFSMLLNSLIGDTLDCLKSNLTIDNALQSADDFRTVQNCSQDFFRCYEPQISILLVKTFARHVSMICTLFETYTTEHKVDFLALLSLVMNAVLVIYVGKSSWNVTLKAEEFEESLYRLVINDRTNSLANDDRTFIHFMGRKKLKLSLMGFFVIDNPLLNTLMRLLEEKKYECLEEVHCIDSDGSVRYADIVAFSSDKKSALLLDPTVRYESNSDTQAAEVDEEKRAIYNKCVPFLKEKVREKFGDREFCVKGLWFGARGAIPKATVTFLSDLGVSVECLPKLAESIILDSLGILNHHMYGS